MRQIQIAPSILSADFSKMGEAVRRMEACGADYIHCDVMDGMFVPNITFGPKMIADIRGQTSLALDVHLMVVQPERYVDRFIEAGADIVTIHAEATDCPRETLRRISAAGKKCGVVLNPETPAKQVFPVLELCDMVLVMSVHPGFGGQKFIPSALEKLKALKSFAEDRGLSIDLEVDGGITLENVGLAAAAGANVIVAGSAVFNASNPAAAIALLRERGGQA